MNREQIKYAANKLIEIYNAKRIAIAAKHKPKGKRLSFEAKLQLIQAGKVTFALDSVNEYTRFTDAFDFTLFQPQEDEEQEEKDYACLLEQKTKIMDELYLGSPQQALELLKQFEALEV